jgi:hypothetical protein
MIPGIVASGQNFPLSLNPALWLDAADTATITESSGSVSQWNDKSGNGRNVTQSNGANQPTTGTRTLNSLNAIDFNGTSDFLVSAATSLVSPTDGTFTAFAVVLPDTTIAIQFILNGDESNAGNRPPQFLRTNGTIIESIRVSTFSDAFSPVTTQKTSALSGGVAVLARSRLTTSVIEATVDGLAVASVGATGGSSATARVVTLGARSGGGLFNGVMCELIAYPFAMSDPDVLQVETYLRNKWGTP